MDISTRTESVAPIRAEFVAIVAMLISLVALSTDGMLAALPDIGASLGVADVNDTQFVVSTLFIGLAVGQFATGPLSDSYGRKPVIYGGLIVYLAGSLLTIASFDLAVMLIGRFLQGLGAAAPRIVIIATVRDLYAGRSMARIMSFAMAVFILVPAVAPGLGQLVLIAAGWRMIFVGFAAVAGVAFVWYGLRQQETLPPERRVPFSLRQVARGVAETCTTRLSISYTLAAGLIFGAFVGYITCAQQIFHDTFAAGALFPLYFSFLALAIGAASIFNSQLVMRFGMRKLSLWALITVTLLSAGFIPLAVGLAGPLPMTAFMGWAAIAFFCMGILFGNFNALAMEPMGHIAGVAAATIGSITTLMAAVAGLSIAQLYDGTVVPLATGFAVLGLLSLAVVAATEGGIANVLRRLVEPARAE